MFDLPFRHMLLMYLVRNGIGFPVRGWIRPFEDFVYASPWQNQCKQVSDCYLPLYLCQQNSVQAKRNPGIRRLMGGKGEIS